jgi:hypothetical protein
MEYNTERPGMKIAEYGRNVQKMVEHIKSLPTKEERSDAARQVISIMTILNPQLKEQNEYKQKLWDHLFMIAGFDLDVEAPFPMPDPAVISAPPQKPSYASNHIKYRYYGKNVERMIRHAVDLPEGAEKDAFVNSLASYMKMAYRVWNEDKVPDEVIIKHIAELSGGKIQVTEITDFPMHTENYQPQRKLNRPYQQNNQQNRQNRNNQRKNYRRNQG